jgi:CubicO group peptidase (beta-lactamase class C family)
MEAFAMQFEAYHGKTSQHHQSRFNALAPNGWRMISLSANGDPANPRYSAVWVKEPSPSYIAVHDLPISQYQTWFNTQTSKGFAPVLVTATGGGGNAKVAAVFEKGIKRGWVAKHGLVSGSDLDQNTIEFWCKKARNDGYVLRSGSIYGSASQRLYIAVWHELDDTHWNYRVAESSSGYQTWFNAFLEVPLRPRFVTLSEHQVYFSAFSDDPIGEWSARHNMTGDGYQAEFNTHKKQGFYPICVQGGGQGSNTRYAAIFAKRHTSLSRVWTVRGAGLSKFDSLVKDFMQRNGVRSGQLTIAKNGVFKARRAYTWADQNYRVTEISHLMRVASLSKMFTCACVQNLYDKKTLKESDKIFAKLGITQKALASQTVDVRVKDITVEHCVDHEGGWDSSTAGDWIFKMRKIAKDLSLSGPVSKHDILRYCYGEPLQFKPGTKSQYSNLGYTALTRLVEVVTGQSYEGYLRNSILAPDGITAVRLSRTRRTELFANEVVYDDPNVGWTAEEPTKEKLTAYCYGGEGWITEAMDGSGGLCATADALVQFIRLHAVWGRGGRMAGAARTGSMAGVSSRAQSRTDGVDFAFVFNTRHLLNKPVDDFANELDSMIGATSL